MIPALANDQPSSPCYFTHSKLATELSAKRYPKKRKPFSSIAANPLSHTLDLILPEGIWRLVEGKISQELDGFEYYKASMTLLEVVSGDFFNQYIKIGNIAMISEGRPLVDNRFSLLEGVLKLELDKPTYERCGLEGKPLASAGRKHVKQRFLVDINLRLPHMVHGKKGFERIVTAFTKVLTDPINWLFVNIEASPTSPGPITQVNSGLNRCIASKQAHFDSMVPILQSYDAVADMDYQEELLEWLGLVLIGSPRILSRDKVDPYLCRYQVPQAIIPGQESVASTQSFVHLQWRGLLTSIFVMKVLWAVKEHQGNGWFALNGISFEGNSYTTVFGRDGDILLWELD